MDLWSHDRFTFPLPATHNFPLAKYARLRARLEAVGQAHDARVRERERAAQQVQRLTLGVVAERDERRGIAVAHAGRAVDRRGRAVGERQREGAEEVRRALVRGHGGARAASGTRPR